MFFGASVSRSKSYTLSSESKRRLYIQNIALDKYTGNKKVDVIIETQGSQYTLCSLKKYYRESYMCVFFFTLNNNQKYKFIVESEDPQAKIYMTGFYEGGKSQVSKTTQENEEKDIDDNNDVLSDNEEINIEKLLQHKRKGEPQDFKPIKLMKMNNPKK